MSWIKRWFEDHVNDFSDEELLDMGYSKEDIEEFREAYPDSRKLHAVL